MLQLIFILSIFNNIFPIDAYYVPANGEDWTILKPDCQKLQGSFESLPFTFGIVVNPYVINDEGDYEEPVVSKIERTITTSFVTSVVTAAPKPTKTRDIIVQIHDGQVQKVASGYDWKNEEKHKDWDDDHHYDWKDDDKHYTDYDKSHDDDNDKHHQDKDYDDYDKHHDDKHHKDKQYDDDKDDYYKHRKSDVDDVLMDPTTKRRKRNNQETGEQVEKLADDEAEGQGVETVEEVYEDIGKDHGYEKIKDITKILILEKDVITIENMTTIKTTIMTNIMIIMMMVMINTTKTNTVIRTIMKNINIVTKMIGNMKNHPVIMIMMMINLYLQCILLPVIPMLL